MGFLGGFADITTVPDSLSRGFVSFFQKNRKKSTNPVERCSTPFLG
jgi:hypothetical protein